MPATKIKSKWDSGNLIFEEKVAANGGQIIFGGTNGGVDVVFRGTTSGIYSMWDESANAWVNKDINLELGDSDYLIFGDSTDASLGWDATKLALTAATASTFQLGTSTALINTRFVGALIVGSTGKSLGKNVTFYGTTAVNNMVWTAASNEMIFDGCDILLKDSDYLKLGDSTDASLGWDAAKIALTAAADGSGFQLGSSTAKINTRFVGTLTVGSTGKSLGADATFYGTTAINRMIWDADQNMLDFDGSDIHLDDSDYLKLGDSTDASLCWDAAKIALTAATASTFQVGSSVALINTRFVGTLILGSTGKSLGNNVTFYGTTAVNNMVWTAASNELILDGTDIRLNDSDYLKLGDSTDASLCWDTAKIALTAATASTFQIGTTVANINTRFVGTLIAGSTKGLGANITLYGTTLANTAIWTAASNMLVLNNTDIRLGDNDFLSLGDSTAGYDAQLCWDAAKLALTGSTVTAFQVGSSLANVNTRFVGTVIVGTTGLNAGKDVTLFGTTTANYVKLTAASNLLSLINVNMLLGDGEYIRGTSTASNAYSLDAWGTSVLPVVTVKNSTGNTAVKLGFFGATPLARQAHLANATTLSDVVTQFNALLVYLENYGLVLTS